MKLDGNQERSAEAGTSMAIKSEVPRPDRRARRLWTPSTKGNERSSDPTLSQANISNGRKSKGRGRPRSVPRSNREKKCCSGECPNQRLRVISREKKQSSLAKQNKIAMMSSISPSEEQTGSKAKKNWKSFYDERMASLQTEGLSSSYDHLEITHPDVDFTPCPRNDMSRKSLSTSPTRTMSDGITSNTRLQPQLTSSSRGLTPASGAAGDISDMFAGVMTDLEELRRGMTKRINRVEETAHQGQGKLRDELTHVKSQARVDQAQLIHKTDQCLVESLAQANKESEENEVRMTREIERLLNHHDNTYAHTMTSLEKRLDAKSDLKMRKFDEISNESNREERSALRELSR